MIAMDMGGGVHCPDTKSQMFFDALKRRLSTKDHFLSKRQTRTYGIVKITPRIFLGSFTEDSLDKLVRQDTNAHPNKDTYKNKRCHLISFLEFEFRNCFICLDGARGEIQLGCFNGFVSKQRRDDREIYSVFSAKQTSKGSSAGMTAVRRQSGIDKRLFD